MAINAYTGLMGSGKSYEVVSSVIVPAVIAGRRVVTNIDGIQPDAIRDYCIDVKKADPDALGTVLPVTNDDVTREGFFPDETKPDAESVVLAGDLVAIDEAWNFWSVGNKLTPEHMRFFRMHRHYVHPETGVACDVALMIQSIGDLHRQLRSVVEMTFVTKKLKELGLNRSYRVEMYEGGKVTKANRVDTFSKMYSKAIFPLYQSYAGGKGKERAIDKRQNKLANLRIWFIFLVMVGVVGVSAWYITGFFRGDHLQGKKPVTEAASASGVSSNERGVAPRHDPTFSTDWRVAGRYTIDSERHVVVADSTGRLRVESPAMFQNNGIATIGTIDGRRVTVWSGSRASAGFMGDAQ
ncbi:zonular occludens toxin domain-containing protein [Pandoraea cepalis]|uniref:Zonular occludens toxin n=1 Tax=Pandoraea cepalis TaxID=2508294 RepID=A0A5E4WAV1_9BURK|nr:zonular occludens toxin domain-containing protein [Pandoraea cepalis]VVE20430.1 Zonular occludens toxin [Pandoraea cepalis]